MEAASKSPAKSLTNPRGGGIAIWSRTAKTITAYCCTPTAQPSRRFLHGLARDLDPRCRRPHRAVPDSPGVARTLAYGWLTGFRSVGVATIAIVLGLAFLGEFIDQWLGFYYAKRYGGSTRSGWGALI